MCAGRIPARERHPVRQRNAGMVPRGIPRTDDAVQALVPRTGGRDDSSGQRRAARAPLLAGRTSAANDPSARGAVVGWTDRHTAAHMHRAIMEGIAMELAGLLDLIQRRRRLQVDRIVLGGGGALSDLWCQILADVLGTVCLRPSTVECASRGAAMLAMRSVRSCNGTDGRPAFAEALRRGKRGRRPSRRSGQPDVLPEWTGSSASPRLPGEAEFRPTAAHARVYSELRAVHSLLYPATRDISKRLGTVASRPGGTRRRDRSAREARGTD